MPTIYTKDYYSTLGIKFPSSPSEIKAAYRNLVKFAHPDAGGTVEQMQALNEAYAVLFDPAQKIVYDLWYENSFKKRKEEKTKKEKSNITLLWLVIDHQRRTVHTEEETKISAAFLSRFKSLVQKDGHLYAVREIRKNGEIRAYVVSAADWHARYTEAISKINRSPFASRLLSSVFVLSRKILNSFFALNSWGKLFSCFLISLFTLFPLCCLVLLYIYLHGKLLAVKECLQAINAKTVNNVRILSEIYANVVDLHDRTALITNIFTIICCILLFLVLLFLWDYKRSKKGK